jgi:outer membrane protein assembly factor BamA
MDYELALGGAEDEPRGRVEARVIPVQIGSAAVYVEQVGEGPTVEQSEEIYPVGPPSPTEAFDKANEALKECVRVVGETLGEISAKVKPQEVSLEFSISFQAEGTARIIPVLVTGKTAATTGLRVTAKWQLGERKDEA